MKLSIEVRDAQLDVIETVIGLTPFLYIYGGIIPTDCESGDTGSPIASGTLPSDWMDDASGAVKVKAGLWALTGTAAAGGGTIGTHFRIKTTGGVCHAQGTFGIVGDEDMVSDIATIVVGQVTVVATFSLTQSEESCEAGGGGGGFAGGFSEGFSEGFDT